MKLTPRQKKVIKDLQNGYVLITDNSTTGAWVGNHKEEYRINNRLFYNLMDLGLIIQQYKLPFDYILTPEGKTIQL